MKFSAKGIQQEIRKLLEQPEYTRNFAFDKQLDRLFYPNLKDAESQVSSGNPEVYAGLNEQALLTSYLDYFQILQDLPRGEILVDLGAGYARGTLLSEYLGLNSCLSLELSEHRVNCAKDGLQSIGACSEKVICTDLGAAELPQAYGYYLYFPVGKVLNQVLAKLFKMARKQKEIFLYACESHGELLDFLNGLEGILEVKRFKTSLQRHHNEIVKYKIKPIAPDIHWQQNIGNWFIQQQERSLGLVFNYYHPLLKKEVEWLQRFEDLELITYQRRPTFQDRFGRRIDLYNKEYLKRVIALEDEIEKYFSQDGIKKLFIDDGLFAELKTGNYIQLL